MTNIDNITMADLDTISNLLSYGVSSKLRNQVTAVGRILNALRATDKPMRCGAIAEGSRLTVQQIAWTMRRMMWNGMVKRVPLGSEDVEVKTYNWRSGEYETKTLHNCPINGYVLAR